MIEVKNLVKKYGDHFAVVYLSFAVDYLSFAVNHLSFKVKDGQIYGFLESNGAGKSTTMNIITEYIGATEGEAVINGHNIFDGG